MLLGILLEAALAADPVFNADGSWSKPDTGLRIGTTEWRGDILWQYVGMGVLSAGYEGDVDVFVDDQIDAHVPSREERIIGSRMLDGLGQEWIAIDVAFSTDSTHYDNLLDSLGNDDDFLGFYHPNATWEHIVCSDGNDGWIEGNESRSQFSSLTADRHLQIMKIRFTDGTGCSGVEVGTRDVLTNAHCLVDTSGNWKTVDVVCSRGNYYTSADCISAPPGGFNLGIPNSYSAWTGGGDTDDDYGLIQWLSGGSGDSGVLTGHASTGMELSTRTDSQIESETVRMYGFPLYTHDDEASCFSTETGAPVDSQYAKSWELTYEARSDHWVTSALIKTYMDCTDGQSGGAYFVCPTNSSTCANGEELVGIHSGSYQPVGYARFCGGPKTAEFADFVDANL